MWPHFCNVMLISFNVITECFSFAMKNQLNYTFVALHVSDSLRISSQESDYTHLSTHIVIQ